MSIPQRDGAIDFGAGKVMVELRDGCEGQKEMTKRKNKKKPIRARSPVPPPTVTFKDRRKETKRKACRGPLDSKADPPPKSPDE